MPTASHDDRGILSLPVKLAVSFLIIGLMMPPVVSMVENLEGQQEVAELSESCDSLVDAMTRAYYSGIGNRGSFLLRVPPGGTLCIGGETDGERYSVRMLEDGEKVGTVMLDRPPFGVYGPVQYLSDTCYLTLSCVVVGEGAEKDIMVKVEPYDRIHHVEGGRLRVRAGPPPHHNRVHGRCTGRPRGGCRQDTGGRSGRFPGLVPETGERDEDAGRRRDTPDQESLAGCEGQRGLPASRGQGDHVADPIRRQLRTGLRGLDSPGPLSRRRSRRSS